MRCPHCQPAQTRKRPERTELGYRQLRYRACHREFNECTGTPFNHLQSPSETLSSLVVTILWVARPGPNSRSRILGVFLSLVADLLLQRAQKFHQRFGTRLWFIDVNLVPAPFDHGDPGARNRLVHLHLLWQGSKAAPRWSQE